MNKIIIIFCGPLGSGKDTLAKHLINNYGFTKAAFADSLRKSVVALFDLDLNKLNEQSYKASVQPTTYGFTVRHLLQVGAEWVKTKINKAIFVDGTIRKILADNLQRVVITDCRFLFEYKSILQQLAYEHDYTVYLIYLKRKEPSIFLYNLNRFLNVFKLNHLLSDFYIHESELEYHLLSKEASEIYTDINTVTHAIERLEDTLDRLNNTDSN